MHLSHAVAGKEKGIFKPSGQVNLTPTPFAIFKILADSPEGCMKYKELREKAGFGTSATFAKHIQGLVQREVLVCRGPHRDRDVHLIVRPSRVREVASLCDVGEGVRGQKRQRKSQLRSCLKCGGKFRSHWVGERVCEDCKRGEEWQAGDSLHGYSLGHSA